MVVRTALADVAARDDFFFGAGVAVFLRDFAEVFFRVWAMLILLDRARGLTTKRKIPLSDAAIKPLTQRPDSWRRLKIPLPERSWICSLQSCDDECSLPAMVKLTAA